MIVLRVNQVRVGDQQAVNVKESECLGCAKVAESGRIIPNFYWQFIYYLVMKIRTRRYVQFRDREEGRAKK